MFKISSQSLKAFNKSERSEFQGRLIRALRQVFSAETERFTDAHLGELADLAMDRSGHYDLELEYSMWAMYAAMFVFGWNFDTNEQHQWSRDVLHDENLAEDAVVGLLGLRIYMATGKTI